MWQPPAPAPCTGVHRNTLSLMILQTVINKDRDTSEMLCVTFAICLVTGTCLKELPKYDSWKLCCSGRSPGA